MKKIAVLASGNGTNLQAIINSAESGKLDARVCLVVSDKKEAYALKRAEKHGISSKLFVRGSEDIEEYSGLIAKELENAAPDLIVFAGFMKILPPSFVQRFEGKMINTHSSLLPCFGGKGFYGKRVHKAVLDSGARITGCTVHFVSSEVDGGPIIDQDCMEILDSDTPASLADRLRPLEHKVLVRAISRVIDGRYHVEGKRVVRQEEPGGAD